MSFGTVRTSTHILETIDASPAQEAGLQKGDKIIEINGRNLENMSEEKAIETIRDVIKSEGGQPLRLTILRDGEAKEFEMLPNYNTEKNTYEIGIYFGRLQRHGPLSSIKLAFIQTGRLIILMIQLVGSMIFKGQVLNEVVGPVGIVGEINKAVQSGIHDVINFAITITLNLGIINLIPFPALDGGRLALLVVEGLRGRPIDSQKEGYIHFVGFVLLMLLMIVVTFKDIVRQWF